MPEKYLFKSDYWRIRADEMRQMASEMQEQQGYAILLRIADEFDELAARARVEERTPRPSAEILKIK